MGGSPTSQAVPAQVAVERYKRAAAGRALELVRPGMLLGRGTGSTARYFIEGVGKLVAQGMRLQAVMTSHRTEEMADRLGIPRAPGVDPEHGIDLTVDGADEIDPQLNCVKGRGGALLREKLVAHASRHFVLIADESKAVSHLGNSAVPIEVLPFLWELTAAQVEQLGGRAELRRDGPQPALTDNGNYILDVSFGPIADPQALGERLHAIPGVLEHGLFVGMATGAVLAGAQGLRVQGVL